MKHIGLTGWRGMASFGNLKEHTTIIRKTRKNGIAIEENACNISRQDGKTAIGMNYLVKKRFIGHTYILCISETVEGKTLKV